jgi:hypothetical protein
MEANFPGEGLRLENRAQARMVWDEHGGTFVLRVEGLEVPEAAPPQGEPGIRLEFSLPEPESLAREVETFGGRHSLRPAPESAGPELAETPILVACHIPGRNLFIFCEESRLTVRLIAAQTMELLVTGVFKARQVRCTEPDLVIHLTTASMARLLGGLLGLTAQDQHELPG